jgi:membrane protease subunit (stomatin/prohibitin family)
MTKVYDNLDFPMVGHFRSILESMGIRCEIRNEAGMSMAGEVPFTSVFPELWVIDDEQVPLARQVIDDYLAQQQSAPPPADWACANCGEQVDGNFAECWNCGTQGP